MPSRDPRLSPTASSPLLSVAVAASVALGGCASMKGQNVETVNEGIRVEQRAAEADARAQAEAGAPALQGTTSPVPSLVPGEGQVSLQAPPAPPPTAPPEDKFDKNNPAHFLARCRDREVRKEWFDAVGDCRRAAELDPTDIAPQEELMRLLVTLQAYADAAEAANKVLAAKPNDPVALYYLAWSYRGREEYPKAVATLQRAIAADPRRSDFVYALGITWCLSENYGKCIESLQKAQSMSPQDTRIPHAISSAKAVLSDKLAPYAKLVAEKPESYDNHAGYGFMLQKYGLPQKALAEYDTALAKMPGPLPSQDQDIKQLAAQIYYNRGVVYRELGKPDLAEPALWQSMQLDASLASFAWYSIGLCRYDSGKYDTSIDALRKSIDLAPDVADNRLALADAYDKAGKAAPAAEQRNAARAIQEREEARKDEERKALLAAEAKAPRPPSSQPAPLAPEPALSPGAATAAPAAPAKPNDSAMQPVDDSGDAPAPQ